MLGSMRHHVDTLRSLVRHVVVNAAVGFGPLYAGSLAVGGFRQPDDLIWHSDTEPWLPWLALVILGYFFGWTITALSLDHEDFWRVPGRVRAFRALARTEGPDGPVAAFAASKGGSLAVELAWPRLQRLGLDLSGLGFLRHFYATLRGWWLAAMTALLFILVHIVRQGFAGDAEIGGSAVSAVGVAAAAALAALGSHVVGRALAARLATAFRLRPPERPQPSGDTPGP